MKRFLCSVSWIFASLAGCSSSQGIEPQFTRTGLPLAELEDMYISKDEATVAEIAEWVETTEFETRHRVVVGEKALQWAPARAVKYRERTYAFPTGKLRLLDFAKDKGGVLRKISDENILFILEGTGTVDVDGVSVEFREGSVINRPDGYLRGAGDARILAWTVSDTHFRAENPDYQNVNPRVMHKSDAVTTRSAEWEKDGERIVVTTPEEIRKAPSGAIKLALTVYSFDDNVVAIAEGEKGGPTYEYTSEFDQILYINSGHYSFFQDNVRVDVREGDVIREIAGHYHYWIRHEDSSFIASTTLPLTPDPIEVANAEEAS